VNDLAELLHETDTAADQIRSLGPVWAWCNPPSLYPFTSPFYSLLVSFTFFPFCTCFMWCAWQNYL